MDPLDIIQKYYATDSRLYNILLYHSLSVAEKAMTIALNHPEMQPDLIFIRDAAILHDIGIFLTHAPDIDCVGAYPYICHGYLGHDLLQKEGLPRHALVCERHTGMGLSLPVILENNLPVPHRDLLPVSIEEEMICFADKFFSKTALYEEKKIGRVRKGLFKYGSEAVSRFDDCCKRFL
ncbi:MAG: HDIG domain-containing protein [Dysgonamonadaceae bacterium]|jgi:uncharacterized protein|nr:HDIG domain-containing protein [Dysgonamonadaceae bacterium]